MFLKTSSTVLLSVVGFTTLSSFSFSQLFPSADNDQTYVTPQTGYVTTQSNQPSYSSAYVAPQPGYVTTQSAQPSYSTTYTTPQPGYGSNFVAPQQSQMVVQPVQPQGYANTFIVPQQQPVVRPAPVVANPYVAYPSKQHAKLAKYVTRDRYVWFYDKHSKHTFFLSNFYPVPVQAWGMSFPCAESAYQAAKFADKPQMMAHFTRLDGETAKKLARQWVRYQRPDWSAVREMTMLEVLRSKFQQNPQLRELLLATGDAYLVEHTKKDAYWGDGGKGRGQNRLGYLLMQLRGEMGGVGIVQQPPQYWSFVR